jgi:RNA polymerase sigma factor (sigma-70 family)
MANRVGPSLLRAIHSVTSNDLTDRELIQQFVDGNETAFSILVNRHSGMVLGVCSRVLTTLQDAEDAFQATFLVLAKKAKKGNWHSSIANWLYTTARHISWKLQRSAHRRKKLESQVESSSIPSILDQITGREAFLILDEELEKLSPIYREALIVCYLDGLPRDQAASRLGVPLATLMSQLDRGRKKLGDALNKRGISLGTLLLACSTTSLMGSTSSKIAESVLSTMKGLQSPSVSAVVQEVTGHSAINKGVLVVAICFGFGLLMLFHPNPSEQAANAKKDVPKKIVTEKADFFGDPLPEGAIVRLGNTRFRHTDLSHFAISSDSKTAISGGSDNLLRTWDLSTGKVTRSVRLEGKEEVYIWAISPNGRYTAAMIGNNIQIWDVESGAKKALVPGSGKENNDYQSIFFSPDGTTLAMLTWAPKLTLVHWETSKRMELPLPPRQIGPDSTFHGYFSSNGKWVVAGGGQRGSLCVFDSQSGKEIRRFVYNARGSTISPDGKLLVASGGNGKGHELVKFDLATGEEIKRFPLEQGGYSLDISPDGKKLAMAKSDKSCILDLDTGKIIYQLSGRPWEIQFTPDGKTLVATGVNQNLRQWDLTTGKELYEQLGSLGRPLVWAVSLDGRRLASAGWMDQSVCLWDLKTGQLIRQLPLKGDERYIRELTFSSNNQTLFGAQHKGFVQWWEVETGKEIRSQQLATPDLKILPFVDLYRIGILSDGRTGVALARVLGEEEKTSLGVWDVPTNKLKGHRLFSGEQRNWAWFADGAGVAFPTPEGLVLANGDNPSETRFIIPGIASDTPIVISPNGRLLAVRKKPESEKKIGDVVVIEATTGSVVGTINAGPGKYLAITSDGRTLVTAGDNPLKVFDLATGKEVGRRTLPSWARELLLIDNQRAITALADGTGLVWDLSPFRSTSKLSSEPSTKLWELLADKDAGDAYRALWELSNRPKETCTLICEKLKPVKRVNESLIRPLIAKLDDRKMSERESATKTLVQLGEGVTPVLEMTLKGEVTAEQQKRIEQVLASFADSANLSGELLRQLRAISLLEQIDTEDARKLLGELATGIPQSRLTKEAATSAKRIKQVQR